MHVKAKNMALAGLLAACSAVLLVLSSVIETNSLFLICAASFCVGIAIREWGIRLGFAFLVASTFINLLVAPNKFYCITFAAMGMYLFLSEYFWEKIAERDGMRHRTLVLWLGKYIVFNLMYIPALLFFQELLFVGKVGGVFLTVSFFAGQIVLYIYDKAYTYFQGVIWGKCRIKLLKF